MRVVMEATVKKRFVHTPPQPGLSNFRAEIAPCCRRDAVNIVWKRPRLERVTVDGRHSSAGQDCCGKAHCCTDQCQRGGPLIIDRGRKQLSQRQLERRSRIGSGGCDQRFQGTLANRFGQIKTVDTAANPGRKRADDCIGELVARDRKLCCQLTRNFAVGVGVHQTRVPHSY